MRLLTLLLVLCYGTCVRAQIGLHPPSVDWQQIETAQGRIIFPEGYEARAQRVATLIELLNTQHAGSIGDQHYPFDLVLQTPNLTINGYVGLAPFRSEFFVSPPQQQNLLSTTDWVDLLTIHEFRHVQQNSNERRGITRLFSFLQGQYGWAVLSSLATPNWFSEGDAVIFETALTSAGRGRTPAFSAELRSLLAAGTDYSYAKARNGSFADLVPDHYRYGYAMLTFARERYGNDVWKSVLQDGAAYKSLIYPFSRALEKKTGYTTKTLYRATLAALREAQDSALAARPPLVEGEAIGYASPQVVNYRFPQVSDDGSLLALRSGFQVTPELVRVDPTGNQKDQVLTSVGIQREPYFDVRGNLAVWMEARQDPRYTNLDYSDIVLYELGSGRKRKLTERGKFVSPSLSFDRRQMVAVSTDPLRGNPELVVLDTQSGQELRRYATTAANVIFPRFSPDGQTIYFLEQSFAGIALLALRVESGETSVVRPRSTENIDLLRVAPNGTLTFSSGRDGVDNVYQLDPATGEVRQLTNVAMGAQMPYLSGSGDLYYTEPGPRGMRLHRLAVGGEEKGAGLLPGLPGGMLPAGPSFFERPAAYAEEAVDLSAGVEAKTFPTRNFSDQLGGIKLHSWSYNGSYVVPGLTIEATNALETVALSLEGLYNINEDRYSGIARVSYGGLYPVLNLSGQFRDRNFLTLDPARDTFLVRRRELQQVSFSAGAEVPLQWVAGDYLTSLSPAVAYTHFGLRNAEGGGAAENFGGVTLGLGFSSFRRMASQQVQSRLGIALTVLYDRALGDEDVGQRLLLRSALNLPGLWRTHGLRIELDYQREPAQNQYQYPDVFRYSRGYAAPVNDGVYRLGINYQLPLVYPEIGLAGITYFKRVRLNAFYDRSTFVIDQYDFSGSENSVGGQLLFDNTWLNTQDITIGAEFAYRLNQDIFSNDANDFQFRFLLGGSF